MQKKSGFTLVELSIVIVIIGLIVAGVMAGQSLVRQAQIRSILAESNHYQVALNTFRLQYNGLPGDLSNAYSYWGNSCTTTPGAADECNGNSDRVVVHSAGGPDAVESLRAWQHLHLAGLSSFYGTGIGGCGDNRGAFQGVNVPPGKLKGSGWMLWWSGSRFGSQHVFSVGFEKSCWSPLAPLFSTTETRNIDAKIDDGQPLSGKIWARHEGDSGSVPDTNCHDDTNYNLTNTGPGCFIGFRLGF